MNNNYNSNNRRRRREASGRCRTTTTTTIDNDGRIERNDNNAMRLRIGYGRIAMVFSMLFILIVSNPGNKTLIRQVQKSFETQYNYYTLLLFQGGNNNNKNNNNSSNEWFRAWYDFDYYYDSKRQQQQQRLTNYVIFSLQSQLTGVNMLGLFQSYKICKYYDDSSPEFVGRYCEWIADNWCHEKPLIDMNDRPYTTHRILCYSYTALWILFFGCNIDVVSSLTSMITSSSSNIGNIIRDIITTVLYPCNVIVWDLFELNCYIYPTFSINESFSQCIFFKEK